MTEQQEHAHHAPHYKHSQLAVPLEDVKPVRTASSRKENKVITFISDIENGLEEKQRKPTKQFSAQLLSLNIDQEFFDGRRVSPITRSKTFDSSFSPADDFEVKLERKKSSTSQYSKANAQFHKLFHEVAAEELLKQSFTCALQKDMLYHGKLFVSENWIGFNSKVFGKDTKILIPVTSVILIKKTKAALLVPNAVVIATETEKYLFVSLLSRDGTYKLLKSVCSHLDAKSLGTSPNPPSLESSFGPERPTSLPLDTVDFLNLDGVVRHRRQQMEESSSSGSRTPESENYQEPHNDERHFLKSTKNEQITASADIHIKQSPERRSTLGNDGYLKTQTGLLHKVKSSHLLSVNGLLLFYAFLVCALIFSTFYMGIKILALEQRLTSMSSLADFHSSTDQMRSRDPEPHLNVNADIIYEELTANLARLEKVQKNLERLLRETE